MEQWGIFRCRCPLPFTTRMSSRRSGCRLSANTNTSVSGETMSVLVAPDTGIYSMQQQFRVGLLLVAFKVLHVSVCVPLHLLSHATVTCEPSSGPFSSVLMARYSKFFLGVNMCQKSFYWYL